MSSVYEYWIGKGIDLSAVWNAYEEGKGYKQKFQSMQVHLVRFSFATPNNLPLFSHEAIFKTVKGYFHDLKKACLSPDDYRMAGPLFLYEIDRGSSIWSFLGELRQLVLLGTTLADEKVIGQRLDNIEKKLAILKNYFGGAVHREDFEAFMDARTPPELEEAVRRMVDEGLKRIEVSQKPFTGDIEEARRSLIDLKGAIEKDKSGG